jgi:DHA2 family multidrug resistance protein
MTSWLSQQFGRRNYFAVSIIIFTVASFLCGNATNIWELVTFRFIQGLGGGALLVTAQTIITESYPIAKRWHKPSTEWCDCRTYARPPLGGYIVIAFLGLIFFYQYSFRIIATLLTLSFVRSPKYGEKLKSNQVDWLGIILLASFIGSLVRTRAWTTG